MKKISKNISIVGFYIFPLATFMFKSSRILGFFELDRENSRLEYVLLRFMPLIAYVCRSDIDDPCCSSCRKVATSLEFICLFTSELFVSNSLSTILKYCTHLKMQTKIIKCKKDLTIYLFFELCKIFF